MRCSELECDLVVSCLTEDEKKKPHSPHRSSYKDAQSQAKAKMRRTHSALFADGKKKMTPAESRRATLEGRRILARVAARERGAHLKKKTKQKRRQKVAANEPKDTQCDGPGCDKNRHGECVKCDTHGFMLKLRPQPMCGPCWHKANPKKGKRGKKKDAVETVAPAPVLDPEIAAMSAIAAAVKGLDRAQIERVNAWMVARFLPPKPVAKPEVLPALPATTVLDRSVDPVRDRTPFPQMNVAQPGVGEPVF